MPPAVIARVNVLGKGEPSILTFTDRHGREIGDYPQDEPVVDDDGSDVEYDYIDDFRVESQDDKEIPGVPDDSRTSPQDWRWTQSPTKLTLMYKMDLNRSLTKCPTNKEPRANQSASPPKRPCRTLHRLAKEWQQGMPG